VTFQDIGLGIISIYKKKKKKKKKRRKFQSEQGTFFNQKEISSRSKMDTVLEILDPLVLDSIYAKLLPAPVLANVTSNVAITSALARDNDFRIALSIFTLVTLGGWFFYLAAASFSYYVLFDHEIMKHPKFLKNQVSLEIDCAVKAVPGFVCK
jgi:hypothetical protein